MQSIGHDLRRGLNNFTLGNNYKNINKWLGELKNIDASLKVLDKEITTSAKLISGWGSNEGEDLTDVCLRMTQLMEEVGLIHQAYTIQHTAYRKKIKTLKVQEMGLDDNRKKKHDLTNQIAKHQKSSKENPIKMMELQSALERVSAELLTQELQLLQFKRVTIRDAFNAQFDAMIEFGEKMALIAGYGRQITNVIDVGPQEATRSTLYSGSEYTAAAINQVKIAVTTWEPQPIGNPIRPHVAPSQEELDHAYMNRASPMIGQPYGSSSATESLSNDQEHVNGGLENTHSGYWGEIQMLGVDPDGQGSDNENWKHEAHNDYISPPDSNPDGSPYIPSQQLNQLQEQQRQLQLEQQRVRQQNGSSYSSKISPSQQHYQNASTIASSLRNSNMDSYGGGGSSPGQSYTPTKFRRSDTPEMYPSSAASPSPSYATYQPASYDSSLSPTGRGFSRLGFSDMRDRGRLDNSDVYKSEIGTNIASRFTKTPVIMDEK
ncbi:hypothetical protein BGZ80_010089 [Entomortierella chlamydospora]|uniref:Eisosome component PIL1-domain-containing protein n=1 Tax=Entomortierella chlamydospora TaxID=101097 RepID=A0A9P6MV80_9FUNG|nr:hypothetical protein BGZ79_008364 [Entomortierella chlamydospora]KAG0015024.1 hypothetical protein BGZ80_010089 [Entomortierella chlamydospora]